MEADVRAMTCDLKYSGAAARLIAAVAAASVVLVALLPISAALRVALGACVGSMALEAAGRIARHRGPRGVRSLAISGAGEIAIATQDGGHRVGRLCDGSFVAPWLTIVRWRPHGARFGRTVLILPDMVDADAFRRLRVRLRWG